MLLLGQWWCSVCWSTKSRCRVKKRGRIIRKNCYYWAWWKSSFSWRHATNFCRWSRGMYIYWVRIIHKATINIRWIPLFWTSEDFHPNSTFVKASCGCIASRSAGSSPYPHASCTRRHSAFRMHWHGRCDSCSFPQWWGTSAKALAATLCE